MPENKYQKKQRAIRDKKIVKLYPKMTLQKIGDKNGLSRERIRQIIKNK